ncbi:MAG: HAMP domain-containing sensor histidine kinase [Betaproteobacteria bacterium]
MKSLYLRIWLTVLAALSLFALASGWLVQRHMAQERERFEAAAHSRAEAWADLLERSLPPAHSPPEQQVAALSEWSQRLRLPLALDDAAGQRIGVSDSWARREAEGVPIARRGLPVRLDDGRTLWIARFGGMRRPGGPLGERSGMVKEGLPPGPWWEAPRIFGPPGLPGLGALSEGAGVLALVVLLFLAVAAGAWPVVRRLTRRLEALKQGMEAFGAGALHQRVAEDGRDEVAAVAASFNRAAARVETLVRSHQSLLGNASHELRSPLARLKMAVAMLDEAAPPQRERLRQEIHVNIAELDALVEEVLLASRLDAAQDALQKEPVDLLALAAEEAARVQATAEAAGDGGNGSGEAGALTVRGDERLLRRAVRNLLENARRYGGDDVQVLVRGAAPAGWVELRVCDRGPGVPEAWRERIFEPFLRLPGHAEHEGGVGLGLSLVRQIATRHGGQVRCEPREGGGSCFTLTLPV